MSFSFGPLGPQSPYLSDPDDEEELLGQVPQESTIVPPLPDFLTSGALFRPQGYQVPEQSAFAAAATGASSTVARALVGGHPQQEEPFQGEHPLTFKENFGLAMREGMEIAKIGVGTLQESTGETLRQLSPEDWQAKHWAGIIEEYGKNLRTTSVEQLQRLGQEEPENQVQWATRVVGQMIPVMVASSAAAGAALATGVVTPFVAGLVAAGLVMYPTEKGSLQTELESMGLDAERADFWSTVAGVPIALLESYTPGKVVGPSLARAITKVMPDAVKKKFTNRIFGFAKEVSVNSLREGVTEGLQEVIGGLTPLAVGMDVDPKELIARVAESAKAGAVGGGVFAGGFGLIGEIGAAQQQRLANREEVYGRAAVRNFDPDAVEDGTVVQGKRLHIAKNGQRMWRDENTNKLTTKPTPEKLEEELFGAVKTAAIEAKVVKAVERKNAEPLHVAMPEAAAKIAKLSERDITPEAVELNVRNLAAARLDNAAGIVRGQRAEEIQARMAELEAIALDPTNGASHATRISAMAEKRALDYAVRNPAAESADVLKVTVSARSIAELDDETFNTVAASFMSGQNEIQARVIQEAQALRAQKLVKSEANQVQERLRDAAVNRSRGLAPSNRVSTPDGRVGTVHVVRSSGFIDVLFDTDNGETDIAFIDPSTVTILPKAGQTAQLPTGESVEVLEVTDDGVSVELPDGTKTVVRPQEIEKIGSAADVRAELARLRAEQRDTKAAEPQTTLPSPVTAVDGRTGQSVQVTEVGENTVTLEDGRTVARSYISSPNGPSLVSEIRESGGEIPVFQPGTQPSGQGRHINFLQVPEEHVAAFERAIKNKNDNGALAPFVRSLTLLPQPNKPGHRTFAIELPANARRLSASAKRLLGFIGGSRGNITPATLRSSVRVVSGVALEEMGVYSVPDILTLPVTHEGIGALRGKELRAYLRRLTDLGFEVDPVVGAAYQAASEAASLAADARVAGRLGEAEILEIQAQSARTEAAQAAIEQETQERLAVWHEVEKGLRAAMSPRQKTIVDALNISNEADFLELVAGIGRKKVKEVIALRDAQGGSFETIEELLQIDGIGPGTLEKIRVSLGKGSKHLSEKIDIARTEGLKALLADLPGRRAGQPASWLTAFEHPDIPGMHLVIDKEIIETSEDRGRTSEDQLVEDGMTPEELESLRHNDPVALALLTGRGIPGERAVYHIKFITPDLREVRSRTIGHEIDSSIVIPASLARGSVGLGGYASTPPAIVRLNEGVRDGRKASEVIAEMKKERGQAELANIPGEDEPVTIIERTDDGGTVVETSKGIRMELPAETPIESLGMRQEQMVPLQMPRRLSADEVLDEVVSETQGFRKKAGILAVGEWHSEAPGVYGEIREGGLEGGFHVMIMEEPQDRQYHRPRVFQPKDYKTFQSREEAEAHLTNKGFAPARGKVSELNEIFSTFPPVTSIPSSPLEPGGWDMHKVESELSDILDFYHARGFLPQPIRDYAVSFAKIWYQRGTKVIGTKGQGVKGALFGGKTIRRWLNIFEVADARQAAASGDPVARVGPTAPDVHFEGGRVVVETRTAAELASQVRVLDGILVSPGVEPAHPARVEAAKKMMEAASHRDRFLDVIAGESGAVQAIGDLLVKTADGHLGIIVDPMHGTDEIAIQTWKGAEPVVTTMRRGDVQRVRSPDKAMDYYRAALDSLGELSNMPKTKGMGSSPLDADIDPSESLVNQTSREKYIAIIKVRAAEMVKLAAVAEDGNLNGDNVHIRNLAKVWVRMKQLGIDNQLLKVKETVGAGMVLETTQQAAQRHRAETVRRARITKILVPDAPVVPAGREVTLEDPLTHKERVKMVEVAKKRHDAFLKTVPKAEIAAARKAFQEPAFQEAIDPEPQILEVRGITRKPSRARTDIIPTHLIPLLNELAYQEIANTFSTNSPYGDVMAQATLGLLPVRQQNQLHKQAAEFGIPGDLPLWRKAEELMQNVWDPQVAHLLYEMRSEAGFLDFLSKPGNIPPQGIELRIPKMSALMHMSPASAAISFPRTIATRHPTFRMFHFQAEKARTQHGSRSKRGRDIIGGLMALHGVNLEAKRAVMRILRSDALGDLMERPDDILTKEQIQATLSPAELSGLVGFDWYTQYKNIRNLLVEGRRENIRNALVRGFHPQEVAMAKEGEGAVERERHLRQEKGLTKSEMDAMSNQITLGQKVYDLDRISSPAYAKPRHEINTFLELVDEYKNLEAIPPVIQAAMQKSKDAWMIDEFDFWARYGINNYAPVVLQGHHKIFMEDPNGGAGILVGFAANGQQAQEFAFRVGRRNGGLDGIPSNAKLYMEVGKAIADDIDIDFLGHSRFSKWYAKTAKVLSGQGALGAELMRAGTLALRIGGERASPRDLHTQARVGELLDPFEDPYESLLYYWQRTSRNNFLLDIQHAYETAKNADAGISKAEGLDPIYSNKRNQHGNEAVAWYMDGLRDSFMGRPTNMDKIVNRVMAVATAAPRLSRKTFGELRRRMNDVDYDILSDPTFLETLYDSNVTARKMANNLTSFQSFSKLGFNIGSAVINSAQHFAFTPSYLVMRGIPALDAIKFATQGRADAIKYWGASRADQRALFDTAKGGPTVEQQELVDFIRDSGTVTVPARGAGGRGGLQIGETGGAELNFSDADIIDKGLKKLGWASMLAFNGAERSVRLASAFAAKRAAESLGLEYDASVAFAKDVVDNTQFQYYDQALPPFMRGNAGRILFQFTQFVMNAAKYEKDLLMGALPPNFPLARAGRVGGNLTLRGPNGEELSAQKQAVKAAAMFGLTNSILGGGAWVAHRPVVAAIDWLWRTFVHDDDDNPEEALMNTFGGAEDREESLIGTTMGDPEFFKMHNMVKYGLPGLLSLQLSARWGVSGLELDPTKASDLALGPSGTLFTDTWAMLHGPGGFAKMNPEATMFGMHAALIGKAIGIKYPMALVGNALVATEIMSLRKGVPLHDFLRTNRAGRQWSNSAMGAASRGIVGTYDMFWDGEEPGITRDVGLQERVFNTGLSRAFNAGAGLFGFQTIQRAEERALLQFGLNEQLSLSERHSAFLEAAASIAEATNVGSEQVAQLIERASDQNVVITIPEITARMERGNTSAVKRMRAQGARVLRMDDNLNPSNPAR